MAMARRRDAVLQTCQAQRRERTDVVLQTDHGLAPREDGRGIAPNPPRRLMRWPGYSAARGQRQDCTLNEPRQLQGSVAYFTG